MVTRPDKTDEMMRAGLNLIQQALSIYDKDLRLVVCNRPFRQMFGLPDALVQPGAAFRDTIAHLVHSGEYGHVDDPDQFVDDRVEQALAFQPHYLERTRSNGQVISIEGSPLPTGGWVTVYTDITRIRQQETLLRARSADLAEKVLRNSEETAAANRRLASANAQLEEIRDQLTVMESRTRMTAEMVPAHIARIDLQRTYTFSNRRLASVLPGCPEEPLGQSIEDALGTGRYRNIQANLDQAFTGASSVLEFNDPETTRRVRVSFTPDLDDSNAVQGVYLLSMDITEEAQARAALSQTHKRELAAQLTSGLAHDFANLLTIILGTQSRLARMSLGPDAQDLIDVTTAAVRRGGVILDRLAQISARPTINPAPTNLPALFSDLVALATPALPDNIALNAWVRGIETDVLLDAGSLQDSLLNLILNAKHAIGGSPGTITIQAHPEADTWIDITVQDSGPGFSTEALDHAMEPFFTTKGGEGSGLGLSMVYDLTKLAGGHVRLANTRDGGQVRLRLPLRPSDDLAVGPTMVLLVEDNDDIRETVREMLVDMGHQVIEAATAEDAMSLAEIDGIGLVLTDLSLRDGPSGLDLARQLRALGKTLPTRIMTSRKPGDRLRDAAAAECALIAKPFSATQLADFLNGPSQ